MKTFSVHDLEAAAKVFAPIPREAADMLNAIRSVEKQLGGEVFVTVLDDGAFRADFVHADLKSQPHDSVAAGLMDVLELSGVEPSESLISLLPEVS